MKSRVALAVFLLIASAALVYRATRKEHGAVYRNRLFAAEVYGGRFPYETAIHPPYPPSYGIVMGPLLLLPLPLARAVWASLQIFMLVVLWRILKSSMNYRHGHAARAPPLLLFGISILLCLRYLLRDTAGGGGNLVFGTLVCLACLRAQEAPGVDRRPWLGMFLGLVLAAKPSPVLFLPWLFLRGRKRTVAVALTTAALLHLSPLLTLGPELYFKSYQHWIEGVWLYMQQADLFALPANDFPAFDWMHQSLRYPVARFLGSVPAADLDELPEALAFQGLGLSPTVQLWIRSILTATILLLVFHALLKCRKSRSSLTELSAFSVLVCTTLLLSPITWKAHHVQLLPVFFLLLCVLAHEALVFPIHKKRLATGLVVYFVVCTLLSHEVIGKRGKEFMQSIYVVSFGAAWLGYVSRRVLLTCADETPQSAVHPPSAGSLGEG